MNKKIMKNLILIIGVFIFLCLSINNSSIAADYEYLNSGAKLRVHSAAAIKAADLLCVQHGVELKTGDYTRSCNNVDAVDDVLCYILANGESHGKNDYWIGSRQVALWRYLYNNRNRNKTDINNILRPIGERIDFDNVKADDNLYTVDYNKGIDLYNDAIAYANDISEIDATISNLKHEGNKITLNVSGDYDGFELYVNGDKKKTHNSSSSLRNIEINVGSASEIDVEVKAYKNCYTAKYTIYRKSNSQDIMKFSASEGKRWVSCRDSVITETDISLQKIIVAVNNKVVDAQGKTTGTDYVASSREVYNRRRWMMTSETERDSKVKVEISKELTADENAFKRSVPVTIEKDDVVTYKIIVYNNTTSDASNIVIKDRLPNYETNEGYKYYYDTNSITITDANGNNANWRWDKEDIVNNPATIRLTIDSLGGASNNSSHNGTWFLINVKFNKISDSILRNTAWISKVSGGNEKTYRTKDRDYVQFNTEVSLQKHITEVNGVSVGTRYNKMASSTDTVKQAISSIGPRNADARWFKGNNAVEAGSGDTVTYKIEVYNNTEVDARNVTVTETLPSGINTEIIKITKGSNNADVTEYWGVTNQNKTNKTFSYTFNLSGNSWTYFLIKVKFTGGTLNTIYKNTVTITSVENGRPTEYRQTDYDYIILSNYSVKLEKYISNIKDGLNPPTYNANITDRVGHPIYDQKGFSKESDPEIVEVGDKITYTIKLTNTGTGDIKSLVITDNPTGLTYVGSTGVTPSNGNKTFNYSGTIEPGQAKTFTVTYTINTDQQGKTIPNTATVSTSMLNKYDRGVTDSDGSTNNTDTDWVKTKVYRVSLEKYVSAVNNGTTLDPNVQRVDHAREYTYKRDRNPVLVNKGDKVTYTIKLTNTGNNTTEYGNIKNLVIEDICPNGLTYDSCSGVTKDPSSNNKFTYNGPIAVGGTATFTITYTVNNNVTQGSLIENIAEVKTLQNKNNKSVNDNDGTTNNTDKDWIKLRVTSVAIEKFVTEVISADGTAKYDQASGEFQKREGYRYNEDNKVPTTDTINKDPYKKNNYVKVEVGDTVTFTIRLQNTGELPVKITQIYDSYTNYNYSTGDKKLNGTGLTLIEDSVNGNGAAGNNNGYTLKSPYGSTNEAVTRYQIIFTNPVEIQANSSTDVTIQFTVNTTVRGKVDLRNKAAILEIFDTYGNKWSWDSNTKSADGNQYNYMHYIQEGDFDGPNNNYDMDFLEVQEYKVSLQKIVYSVDNNTSGISSFDRWNSWESHANTCACNGNTCTDKDGYGTCDICGKAAWYNTTSVETGNTMVNNKHSDEAFNKGMAFAKHNNPVTVANGNTVTYAIKVRNDGETKVKVTRIIDNLPEGVSLEKIEDSDGNTFNRINGTISYHGTYMKVGEVVLHNGDQTNLAGARFGDGEYVYNDNETGGDGIYIFPKNKLLEPNGEYTMYVTVKVTESNMSLDVLRNYAYINWIRNKNESFHTFDVTVANNDDADYIQMKDITISGTVWNDRALNKTQDNYNGSFDQSEEAVLKGVTVKLYRDGVTNPIAITHTDDNGKYSFDNSNIDNTVITNTYERYIKAQYEYNGDKTDNIDTDSNDANYWNTEGKYYSYYIVFEYDGITYTSTVYTQFGSNADTDLVSNAREKLDTESYDGKVVQSRTTFNNRYDTIDSGGAYKANGDHTKYLIYDTENNSGYIPSSLYSYEKSYQHTINGQGQEAGYNGMLWTMLMQSSTNKINLSNSANLDAQLQHVNLGLRGRDIFDLELTSDVHQIEVTVNDKVGVYKYSNKVTLRRADLTPNSTTDEDMANKARESSHTYVDKQEQKIRNSDINVDTAKYSADQGLSNIQVTYKLTVQNTSRTDGTATKIIDYYDEAYSINSDKGKVAYYYKDGVKTWIAADKIKDDAVGSGYKSIVITTPGTNLSQSETMDIYVVYTLNNPVGTLKDLTEEGLPTYNMAEITEYKTFKTTYENGTNNEATRGLIDKDSASGSANREQVRLTSTEGQNTATTGGNPTTVGYYFGGNDLSQLKYEDDTYATPTLYFVKDSQDNNIRAITGIVFEDLTQIKPTTKIKTGNGKLDEGEAPVYGATVELVENGTDIIRYTTTTGSDGKFEFKGFLPGDYIIRYRYGNTDETVLINEHNNKSYNGEDFQATNNAYVINRMDTNILKYNELSNNEKAYWYVYNESEGISTAKDDSGRRDEVSAKVTNFIDEQMTVLNNMRDGKNADDAKVTYNNGAEEVTVNNIIEDTKMWAETEPMTVTVEKTELVKNNAGEVTGTAQRTTFGEYKITNMNFGIAEVPVSTVDLQKHVKGFTIKDSTGKNVIASLSKNEDGSWNTVGDVLPNLNNNIDISIENEKLQGAKLEVTYTISTNINTEVNFDGIACVVPQISGVADFVDNNLSYNSELGDNDKYWKITTFANLSNFIGNQQYKEGSRPTGTIDSEGKTYSTILMATYANPLIGTAEGESSVDITLEKVLSSTDLTIEDIITSTVDTSECSNIVEIIGFRYLATKPENPREEFIEEFMPDDVSPEETVPQVENTPDPDIMRDRVRTFKDRYIFIPGVQHDSATSETIVWHPPTGTTQIDTMYYIVAVIALGVLAAGVFGIKKFVIKK